jgi:hypothetical protein
MGGFGGLRMNAARGQTRRAAELTLGIIKQALEAAKPQRGKQARDTLVNSRRRSERA